MYWTMSPVIQLLNTRVSVASRVPGISQLKYTGWIIAKENQGLSNPLGEKSKLYIKPGPRIKGLPKTQRNIFREQRGLWIEHKPASNAPLAYLWRIDKKKKKKK